MTQPINKFVFSHNLRKEQTDAEKRLWSKLRDRRLSGIKFRRQQVIGPYIVDFVTFEKNIIIELDGGQHNSQEGKVHDGERTRWLNKEGYVIIRFWNNEVLTNIPGVMESLLQTLSKEH